MSLRDELTNAVSDGGELTTRKREWRPGVEWLGDHGTVVSDPGPASQEADWDQILRQWNLDPAHFQVVEPVLFNTWGGVDGQQNKQWKAKVVRRTTALVDLEPLIKEALKKKPSKRDFGGEGSLNVVLADWQIGKADGDGLEGTIQRVINAREALIERLKELRRAGRPIGKLNVLWTGDSIEACVGHYPSQTFAVELDRRDQVKVTRRLLTDSLMAWSKYFDDILVAAVGGNHGENRQNGKAFTGSHDNDDLAVVEQVAEILAANPDAFGHVKFAVARDSLTCVVPSAGWILGLTHGHVAGGSGNAENKLRNWWQRQAGGRQPIGDSDVLVTGHYHHLRVADWGGCVWLQAPALDGGSEYWRVAMGEQSQAGMLTFGMYPNVRVSDIAVL
jgi:predicted phosphodiesterase